MWKKKAIEPENRLDEGEVFDEEKDEEIEESLQEIYEDEEGGVVDVKKFDIKKRRGPLFWAVLSAAIALFGGLGGWLYYDYYSFKAPVKNNFELSLEIQSDKITAGEPVTLKVIYKNMEKVPINNLEINVAFPDNFLFLSASPESSGTTTGLRTLNWKIGNLNPKRSGEIIIKGSGVAKSGDKLSIFAEAGYVPSNFSSRFSKSASADFSIKDIGIDFAFNNFSNVIAGDENEFNVKFKKQTESYLDNFVVALEDKNDNFQVIPLDYKEEPWLAYSATSPLEWTVKELSDDERQFPIKFKITDKKTSEDGFTLKFYNQVQGKKYEIYDQSYNFEVLKGDLSLSLIINGSKNDQGINLGGTLNYLLTYANNSETSYKDIVIMAVIDGSLADWNTLKDESGGVHNADNLSWSKQEIPELTELAPGSSGSIEFSLKVKDNPVNVSENADQIKSYATYSLASSRPGADNQSNTIITRLDSRINFSESIRYFNEDNIAVGSGPIPPQAGQTTSYKVTWTIGGNIHELGGTKVAAILPEAVSFAGGSATNVGQIDYDFSIRSVVWNIGRLPVIGETISGSFNITVTPSAADINKVLVLSAGAKATGLDTVTASQIEANSTAKTTKLEDDDIGRSDGVVK